MCVSLPSDGTPNLAHQGDVVRDKQVALVLSPAATARTRPGIRPNSRREHRVHLEHVPCVGERLIYHCHPSPCSSSFCYRSRILLAVPSRFCPTNRALASSRSHGAIVMPAGCARIRHGTVANGRVAGIVPSGHGLLTDAD